MDPEQGISEKDLGIATKTQETKPAAKSASVETSNNEAKQDITLAEDIALFRTELEQRVFFEGLPVSEWRRVYEETLAKYPDIQSYKGLFDQVLNNAEVANKGLLEFWRKLQNPQEQSKSDNPLVEKASPQAAREMCYQIFGSYPQSEVEAVKGAITLRFMVDDSDFKTFYEGRGDQEVLPGGFAMYIPELKSSVLVLRKSQPEHKTEVLLHELEHGKNIILVKGRRDFLDDSLQPDRFNIPEDILTRLKRRGELKQPYPEVRAKDEILAFSTTFSYLDYIDQSDLPMEQLMQEWKEHVKDQLTDKKGFYFPNYYPEGTSSQDEKRYMDNVTKGVDAMMQLLSLYRSLGFDTGAGRMATNVLEQFPLNSWSAVTRLIQTRHAQKDAIVLPKAV